MSDFTTRLPSKCKRNLQSLDLEIIQISVCKGHPKIKKTMVKYSNAFLYLAIELLGNNNPYLKPKTGLIKNLLIISQVKLWL